VPRVKSPRQHAVRQMGPEPLERYGRPCEYNTSSYAGQCMHQRPRAPACPGTFPRPRLAQRAPQGSAGAAPFERRRPPEGWGPAAAPGSSPRGVGGPACWGGTFLCFSWFSKGAPKHGHCLWSGNLVFKRCAQNGVTFLVREILVNQVRLQESRSE